MTHRHVLEALTGLLAAFFTAIVANALTTIMDQLHCTQTDFAWVIMAALPANAAATPMWGRLADLFDKKLLVQLSIIIFVAGSAMAGFATTIPLLLTARVIQGIAMGGLTALAQAIIGTIISPRERGRYSGQMVTRFGRWKRFLVGGALLLIAGLGLTGTITHDTNLALVGSYTFVFGLGPGMMMQNLLPAVQNTVAVKDIGSASGSAAFFRTVGGAAGVAILGAVMGTRVTSVVNAGLAGAGVKPAGGPHATMDLASLPDPVKVIVRAACGDGPALIFMIGAITMLVALAAVLPMKEIPLRRTIDMVDAGRRGAAVAAGGSVDTRPADAVADAPGTPEPGTPEPAK
ncbi:MFS transporter [Arthrobacter sp. STN4]|uniref:MFS transporter n=1 Tax=Arthrobacter sp. STN4 TaxID=2923276 RepID=UPI00277B4B62|nr:MFS transporter [Arthrobacter sp. STN4]